MGHEVVVLTSLIHGVPKEELVDGIRIIRFSVGSNAKVTDLSKDEIARFRSTLLTEKPEILINHCWDTWPSLYSLSLFSLLQGKKVMVSHGYSPHIWQPRLRPFWGIYSWVKGLFATATLLPFMIRQHDALVFLDSKTDSGRFFDHRLARWMNHPCIRIIPNSLNEAEFRNIISDFRTLYKIGDGFFVLCVANYSERKNQALAIKAFCRAKIPRSSLVFIGESFNEYSGFLKTFAARCLASLQGLDANILFFEKLPRSDTLKSYQACDLVILTSKQETQPIVLLEAMATGKCWLSTDVGSVKKLRGGCIATNPRNFASKLRTLFLDPCLRDKLGQEGKSDIRLRFFRKNVFLKWQELLAELSVLRHITNKQTPVPGKLF